MVDKSPEAAKTRGEATANANLGKVQKQRSDLLAKLGTPGQDNGEWIIGTDQYNQLILFENQYNKKGELVGRNEIFFWVEPNGIDFKKKYGSGVIKDVKTLYKGNLETLRSELYDKNFMSKTDFTTKDETAFNQAILKAARNYSLTQAQQYTIEGKTKFSPFGKWIKTLGSTGGAEEDLPLRDINLMDRDVIEAIVKGVYSKVTDMSPEEADSFIQQETDRYERQIKEGTLTTVKKVGGEMVRTTTKPFSAAQVEAELPERLKKQQPGAMVPKQSFDFLAFIDGLGGQVV